MTLKEINAYVQAKAEVETTKLKGTIQLMHKNAYWTALAMNNGKVLKLEDEFPQLFGSIQDGKHGKESKKMEPWEKEKMKFAMFAEQFNKNRQKEG